MCFLPRKIFVNVAPATKDGLDCWGRVGLRRRACLLTRDLTREAEENPLTLFPQVWGEGTRFLFAWLVFGLVLNCAAGTSVVAQDVREIEQKITAGGIRYGLIRDAGPPTPSPTLFVFAHGLEEMRRQPVYTEVASILALQGWVSVIVDPPCHGADVRDGEPPQLDGWRHRLEKHEDFMAEFTTRSSAVLDQVIKDGITDPEQIAVCGTSRGGFLAYHFAAVDKRVKAAAGISPVTRLTALREFSTTSQNENAERLDVANLAPKLADRSIWLSIGNNDARVSTDDAIAFTRAVVKAAAKPDAPNAVIPVELLVGPSAGHSKVNQAHELLAAWLLNRFPVKPSP